MKDLISTLIPYLKTLCFSLLMMPLVFSGVFLIYKKEKKYKFMGWVLSICGGLGILLSNWIFGIDRALEDLFENVLIIVGVLIAFGLVFLLSQYERTRPLASGLYFLIESVKTLVVTVLSSFFIFILGLGISQGIWFDTSRFKIVFVRSLIVFGIFTIIFLIYEIWNGYKSSSDDDDENIALALAYPTLTAAVSGTVIGFYTAGWVTGLIGFFVGGGIGFLSGVKELLSQ